MDMETLLSAFEDEEDKKLIRHNFEAWYVLRNGIYELIGASSDDKVYSEFDDTPLDGLQIEKIEKAFLSLKELNKGFLKVAAARQNEKIVEMLEIDA